MGVDTSGIAQAVIDLIDQMTVEFAVEGATYTETIKGYRWSQNGNDRLPAGAVLLPAIDRRDADTGETQLGSRDFMLEFPVEFLFDIDRAAYAQELAVRTVEAFIDTIDANPTLSGAVDDAVVAGAAQPSIDTATNRPLIVYPTTLQVWALVP